MDDLRKIEELSRRLVLNDPFTASVLLALEKREVPGSKLRINISKTGQLSLEYDLDFLNKLLEEDPNKNKEKKIESLQLGELKRQIYHLCLFHPLYREGKANKKAFDLACEITMESVMGNQQERNGTWSTVRSVEEFINTKNRKTVQLPTNKTALDYYEILKDFVEDDLPEPRNNDNWSADPGAEGAGAGNVNDLGYDINLLEATLLSLVQEATSSAPGSVPAPIHEWLQIMLKIPKVNYKSFIKTVFTQAGMSQDIIYTRSKPNTRIPQFLGRKPKPAGKMLIYVDASGSMGQEQFNDAISEVNHVKKQLNVEVKIVQFSCMIHPGEIFAAKTKIPTIDRKDYGGTDFTAVVEDFNAQKYAKQCIVFTDGEASTRTQPLRPNNMLWIVINNYDIDMSGLPGKSVMVNTKDD